MNIKDIIDRKIIETFHENRKFPRFKIPDLAVSINNKIYQVEDISFGGLLVEGSFTNEDSVFGKILYKNEKIDFVAKVKHSINFKTGLEFLINPKLSIFVDRILSPEHIVKDFILINKVNYEILWHKTDKGHLFFFSNITDKKVFKVTYVFFKSVIHWEKNHGFKTGVVTDLKITNYPLWNIDLYTDWSKINQLIKAIESASIPKSFKYWLMEEIELSIK